MESLSIKARKVFDFYVDGFKNMTVGRKLWAIILIKVAILFLVFKLFFFPNLLEENYDNDDDRARAVATELTSR
ncbi:MAG: DUF4492 domain-containing protein [Muribaculaceae bacterium]|nr:DUF4492 domain-containing protein [Muribaculaceae bacterium]MDE6522198.1 DUF4492 domain-containing protein [Muribaculaceae bacterium]